MKIFKIDGELSAEFHRQYEDTWQFDVNKNTNYSNEWKLSIADPVWVRKVDWYNFSKNWNVVCSVYLTWSQNSSSRNFITISNSLRMPSTTLRQAPDTSQAREELQISSRISPSRRHQLHQTASLESLSTSQSFSATQNKVSLMSSLFPDGDDRTLLQMETRATGRWPPSPRKRARAGSSTSLQPRPPSSPRRESRPWPTSTRASPTR